MSGAASGLAWRGAALGDLRWRVAPLQLYRGRLGAHLLLRYLKDHPRAFDVLLVASPLVDINYGRLPRWLAHAIVNAACAAGLSRAYVFGGGGAYGAVQMRMIRALHETDLRPDLVVGTSVGSWSAVETVDCPPCPRTITVRPS